MSLRAVVAAPFRGRGSDRIPESEFVVALSLDRDWFSPDQASRIVDIAVSRGLVSRTEEGLVAGFDPESVELPPDFSPDEELLQDPSPFERALAALVSSGLEKREAVAGINRLQADLGLGVDAAAVVYARRQGLDVTELAAAARAGLEGCR